MEASPLLRTSSWNPEITNRNSSNKSAKESYRTLLNIPGLRFAPGAETQINELAEQVSEQNSPGREERKSVEQPNQFYGKQGS